MQITKLLVRISFLLVLAAASQISFAQSDPKLERVLDKMDQAAASFRSTEAAFTWDQYQKVVDETDTQSGKIYFRRSGEEIQMAADINKPAESAKYLLFTDSKIQVYDPRQDQITVYNTKNRSEVEAYLVLGFGGKGHDLAKSFDVKYLGSEKLGTVETEKLDLVPKSEKVRNNFEHIILWIDPTNGISVQQQLFPPLSGDYRLARYSNIKINQKVPDTAFKIKTTGKTKTVSTQG
jgi:outer membrane lipoprotein-sorting protein